MKTKLIYSNKKSIEPNFEISGLGSDSELTNYFLENATQDGNTVYLVALEFADKSNNTDDIYIHHDVLFVEFFISSHIFIEAVKAVYIQEYESYESAYAVALGMREGNTGLCYDK